MCLQPLVDQSCSPHRQQTDQDRLWQRNCLTALSVPKRCIAVAHRRVGRGGRCVNIYGFPIAIFIVYKNSFLYLSVSHSIDDVWFGFMILLFVTSD